MTRAAAHPVLALPVARLVGHGVVVSSSTQLVIEGYPQSGNSAAVVGFLQAQPRPVEVAHHTHAPANVLAGLRRGIPVLVVVRDPREAVVAFALTKPMLSVRDALVGYVRFHQPLVRVRDAIVLARSAQTIDDMATVIQRVNARFGSTFVQPARSAMSDERVNAGVERYWAERRGPGLPLVGRTEANPVSAESVRRSLERAYDAPALAGLRERADRLFSTLS